jgi:hypothetical protein
MNRRRVGLGPGVLAADERLDDPAIAILPQSAQRRQRNSGLNASTRLTLATPFSICLICIEATSPEIPGPAANSSGIFNATRQRSETFSQWRVSPRARLRA